MGQHWSILGLLLACACGSSADEDGGSGNVTCSPDELALEGSLDGEAVSHRSAVSSYAWIQIDKKTLDASFGGGGRFRAEWQKLVGDGQTFAATGNLTLPTPGERAGETLDYASGSFTKLEGGVKFKLSGFTLNVQCITPPCPSAAIDGTLQGCVEPER